MPKTLLAIELKLTKTTKGTHVLANEEAGISIYVPKPFFAATGLKPESSFTMVITEKEPQ